jgi:hypothetical protein
MNERTVTVTLPEALYERVQETARATSRSLEDVMTQSIALSLPQLESDLPPALRADLATLALLSDAKLREVAGSQMEITQQVALEALAQRHKQAALAPEEQSRLYSLMEQAQTIMLTKAEALRLLARRGYDVFPKSTP